MRAVLTLAGLLLALLIARAAMVVVPVTGILRALPETDLSACRRVDVAPGTEDVDIDPARNLAFISASQRRSGATPATSPNGIYALSLDGSDAVRKVSPDEFDTMQPHGISLWRGTTGDDRLFVINHQPQDDGSIRQIVEIFRIESDGTLEHVRSVSFPEMYSPNDVVAVGPDAFYATNDRRYRDGPMALAELYLGLPLTGVVYWDGTGGRDVAGELMYANGINRSPDGSTIYVAEFLDQAVDVYARDRSTGDLSHQRTFNAGTNPDNLSIDQNGVIWIGGHPKALEFQKHAADASHISPSEIVRLDPATGDTRTVFTSLKGEINASATGAVWDDTLIVGAVFDEHVLVCPLAPDVR